MNRRSFLKLLGNFSLLGLSPVRKMLSPTENDDLPEFIDTNSNLTDDQLDALQKIRYFEAQLQELKGFFSWELHNELRHYWGVFSETKSLTHANIILEHSIMDAYILNTLSDWHYAPEYQPYQPNLAITSLKHRAENYSDLYYVKVACWLRTGEINSAIGNKPLAQDYYQHVIKVCEEYKHQAPRLTAYQFNAQSQMML